MGDNLTETIYLRHIFSDKETLDLSRKMAQAEEVISRKADELKSMTAQIKAEIAAQEAVLHSCAEKLRNGYEMTQKECGIKYNLASQVTQFVDLDSGEVMQERPMTKDEQLKLTVPAVKKGDEDGKKG